jgi:hypothetical protein
MGILLIICGLVGIGIKGLSKAFSQADDQGAMKQATQSAVTRLIEKITK